MDWAAIPWGTISPLAALTVVLLMLISAVKRGDLVPARLVNQLLEVKDDTIGDLRAQVSAAATAREIDAESQRELRSQVSELIESSRVTDATLRAVWSKAQGAE